MTAFLARTDAFQDSSGNARVSVFAGKDSAHLQLAGFLVLHPDEVIEFCALVNGEPEIVRSIDGSVIHVAVHAREEGTP